ncbi:MAG: SigF/SigG family RNA polymerase sporulation sigma factor [Clostridiales bacterium]|jgi:RNA polymerase sporulation-specific sigma factor|nr:SigF/SigG family RNA polymerase sporulation sigma factor [Clostridiales bacterium]
MGDTKTPDTAALITAAQAGDSAAAEKLVRENAGLVWSIVRRFSGRGYEAEDLFQVGSIGLLKCIRKFDSEYGVKFSTYAVPMIMGEIKRFLRDDGMLKVSRPIKELAQKAKYAQERLSHEFGRSPTTEEVAKSLEVSVEELVLALEAGFAVESLYGAAAPNERESCLIDRQPAQDKSVEMVDNIALRQIIGSLPKKERQIIIMRYFMDKTQTEVAKVIGVSQVQVSRIEKKALKYLRENL